MIMTFWNPKIDLSNYRPYSYVTNQAQNHQNQTISPIQFSLNEIRSSFRTLTCNSRLQNNTGKGLTFYLAFQAAEETNKSAEAHECLFDSDSFTINIDNCASRCMTNNINHFISPPNQPAFNTKVKGIKSNTFLEVKGEGTIKWKIADDDGRVHSHIIHNALYVPDIPACLLSPQHWAQSANDTYPNRNGTTCITTLDAVVLSWNQGKYKKTVKLDKHTNTARFKSASGSLQYQLFAASIEYKLNQLSTEHVSYMTKNHISSDNEDAKQFSKSHAKQTTDENHIISKRATDSFEENLSDYLMDPGPVPTNVIEEEENQLAARDTQAE